MEPDITSNTYQETNNVHQLYPDADVPVQRESWGVILEKLSTDMTNLWGRQSSLMTTELNEKMTTVKGASSTLIAGGACLLVGTFALAATAIISLSNIVDPWIAAFIVTVILMGTGFIMVRSAQKKLIGRDLLPNRSIETLGQIRNTIQERIHEFKRQ